MPCPIGLHCPEGEFWCSRWINILLDAFLVFVNYMLIIINCKSFSNSVVEVWELGLANVLNKADRGLLFCRCP